MVFFVLEAHGALYFGGGVDERAERITGKRMVVTAGVDVLELAGFVIVTFGVGSFEEEAFNFVGSVERVLLFLEEFVGVSLQDTADIARVGSAALVDDFTENQHFAGAKDVGGRPVKRSPVDAEAKVALALCGEATDGGAVEGQVVPTLEQELLVIVEHVQAAFEIAEEDGDGLDAFLVAEILCPLFPNFVRGRAIPALLLCLEVEFFQFVVGQCQEIAQFSGHGYRSVSFEVSARFRQNYKTNTGKLKWLVSTLTLELGRIARGG